MRSVLVRLCTVCSDTQAALKGAEDVDDADAAARAEQEVQVEMDEFTKVSSPTRKVLSFCWQRG